MANENTHKAADDRHLKKGIDTGELSKKNKDFHFLEVTAQSLSLQVQVMHQKQSILFSLSAGMIALSHYTGMPLWAALPFFLGLLTAMVSILPAISYFSGGVSFASNPFYFGTVPESIDEISELTDKQYAQLYLMNLQQLTAIVTYKNKLIIATAGFFTLGAAILFCMAAFGDFQSLSVR